MQFKFAALFAVALAGIPAMADPMSGEVASNNPFVPASRIGIAVGLGGGVSSFTTSEMSNAVDTGATWEVRSTIGTRLFLAGEVAYVGSRRNLNLNGVTGVSGETPHVFSHGLEGAVRGQYPFFTGGFMIEPFAFGGFGWTHYGVDASVATGSQLQTTSDDVLVVPFGAGVTAGWHNVLLEARFTWRQTFNEDLLKKSDGTIASLSNWSAGATIGYEF